MTATKGEFRQFLLRIAANDLENSDWLRFAIRPSDDCEIENLRQCLLNRSAESPDWQVGWIPRGLQDFAKQLSEYLREIPESTIAYWPEWADFADSGELSIRVTYFDADTHSIGRQVFALDHADYDFWCWVVRNPAHRTGPKRAPDVLELRTLYQQHGSIPCRLIASCQLSGPPAGFTCESAETI